MVAREQRVHAYVSPADLRSGMRINPPIPELGGNSMRRMRGTIVVLGLMIGLAVLATSLPAAAEDAPDEPTA